MKSTVRLDPTEAPPGYMAVLKSSVATPGLGNICRACDWRPECNGFEHRCMSFAVVSARDGRLLKRADGCSVVFKRKASNESGVIKALGFEVVEQCLPKLRGIAS